MIVHPRIMRNTCVNAHPAGCERQVLSQIDYVKNEGTIAGPKNVLIIGASNGYGLAARIVSAFASGASTLGIAYELPATENNFGPKPGMMVLFPAKAAARIFPAASSGCMRFSAFAPFGAWRSAWSVRIGPGKAQLTEMPFAAKGLRMLLA